MLEEWLKATVLRLSERGCADKVMSIRPLHFMTYQVDLPFNWVHLRSVPEFVSAILQHDPSAEPLATGTQEPFALQSRENLFWKAFGNGIVNDSRFAGNADMDRYDDNCEVDIESLLTIRVTEGLRAPSPITVKGNDRRGNLGF